MFVRVLLAVSFACLAGCGKKEPPTSANPPVGIENAIQPSATRTSASGTNNGANDDVSPLWIARKAKHTESAIVFVHGLFGGTTSTWTNQNGVRLFDLIQQDQNLVAPVDTYVFGYESKFLAGGSLSVAEAARRLESRLKYEQVDKYRHVVYVAHSMGGLVVLRYLLNSKTAMEQTRGLIFLSVPQEGAEIAAIAQHVARNPALNQLLPVDINNEALRQLLQDWATAKEGDSRPEMRCGYETEDTFGTRVVPFASATRLCLKSTGLPIAGNHMSMVKPNGQGISDATVLIVNALNDWLVGPAAKVQINFPDFQQVGDDYRVEIKSGNGQAKVRIVNAGGFPGRYMIGKVNPDSGLVISPQGSERRLAAGGTDSVDLFVLLTADRDQYSFSVRTDETEQERNVIVKIPQLTKILEQRGALRQLVQSATTSIGFQQDDDNWALAAAKRVVDRALPQSSDAIRWLVVAQSLTYSKPAVAVAAFNKLSAADSSLVQLPAITLDMRVASMNQMRFEYDLTENQSKRAAHISPPARN